MSTQDIDKETLKADLVKHLKEQADANSEAVALESHEARATETDEVDVDDISHEDEAGDLHAMYQETDDRQQELITTAENLVVSAKETVEPGAVVSFGDEVYLVGVAVSEFESQGRSFSGISTDAPIYNGISGKRAGDTFDLNGTTQSITSVQ